VLRRPTESKEYTSGELRREIRQLGLRQSAGRTGTFIEAFYNRRRLRKDPVWRYLTPSEIRQRHEQGHALAAYASSVRLRGNVSERASPRTSTHWSRC